MSLFKRSPSDSSSNYGGIPPKMPTPIRQRSPMPTKQFLSPPSVDPEPFYLLKDPPLSNGSEVTGETHMIGHYGLEHSYNKFSTKKLKEQLSAFLPLLPGNIDTVSSQDNSSLQSVIEKPPITKEIAPFTTAMLQGFKLHPGSIPDQYKLLTTQPAKKHKHKKHKRDHRIPELSEPMSAGAEAGGDNGHEKKHKKTKKHGDQDGEKKKRDKKKKKKKARQDPMHPGMPATHEGSGPGRP
ncbi:LOW QUALITY PROTEIN: mediator of RNA polymerase II transcription subunit 19-like [Lytechinus variegatus]|uniref:LOW QUALITY PROTEIN: mediator of RNA polymerase II transcription subunit 19-like n=1 Tax=Lytechinus variegatus TaxID=7654 RepID=UPI001BB258BA|nr:LOW QUALITY PROTEIN: mediator of RNA polymerase II transcription subunit 19-like [Lytechinus variegatus]